MLTTCKKSLWTEWLTDGRATLRKFNVSYLTLQILEDAYETPISQENWVSEQRVHLPRSLWKSLTCLLMLSIRHELLTDLNLHIHLWYWIGVGSIVCCNPILPGWEKQDLRKRWEKWRDGPRLPHRLLLMWNRNLPEEPWAVGEMWEPSTMPHTPRSLLPMKILRLPKMPYVRGKGEVVCKPPSLGRKRMGID